MRALGCDEIAALASEKLNLSIDIVHTKTNLTFSQSSQLGDTKRVLHVDGPTTDAVGRVAYITTDPNAGTLTIHTTMKNGKIVDTRLLEGDTMIQTLLLTIKGSDHPIRTTRYLIRKGPPNEIL
jgi:hypothetical protein